MENKTNPQEKRQYSKAVFYPCMAVLMVVLIWLDRWTKGLAVEHLKGANPIVLIQNVLELAYLENHGAAFGMLQNKQYFFWVITVVFLCVGIFFMIKVPKTGRYLPLSISVVVLIAGAIGNFIDRITLKYVVDFVYISLINFPVFNVADIYVTCGVIALIILILFVYKENELQFFKAK